MSPKASYLDIHKKTMDKNYNRKNFEQRLNDFKNFRKQTRQGIFLSRRKINENNVSPFETPEAQAPKETAVKSAREVNTETKIEKLRKWKAEKEKRKLEEKKNAKPRFIVGRVPVEVGMPNFDKAITEIKGKRIKSIYKFAPENHIFKPPSNVERLKLNTMKETTSCKANTNSTNKLTNTKAIGSKKQTQEGKTANRRIVKPVKRLSHNPTITASKQSFAIDKPATLKSVDANKVRTPGATAASAKKKTVESLASKPTSTSKPSTIHKNVWKIKTLKQVKFQERNSVGLSRSSPKKGSMESKGNNICQENKVHNGEIAVIIINDTISNDNKVGTPMEQKSVIIYSDDEITMRTPRRTGLTPSKKIRKSTPFPKASNNSKLENGTVKEQTTSKILSLKLERCDDIPAMAETKKYSIDKCEEEGEEPKSIIIYSDDEISMKTPRQNGLTPARKSKKSTPFPKASNKMHFNIDKLDNDAPQEVTCSQILSIALNRNDIPLMLKTKMDSTKKYDQKTPPKTRRTSRVSGVLSVGSSRKSAKKLSLRGKRLSATAMDSQEAADYFTKMLDNEITRIEAVCAEWDEYKIENDLTEDSQDMINAAIGQSKLLIRKKFPQFRDLIDKCRSRSYEGGKPVTSQDLHGYWDTAYIQVQDLDKRFDKLEILKQNNWEEVVLPKEKVTKKKKKRGGAAKKKVASSRLKDVIKAAREKTLKEKRSSTRLSRGRRSGRISASMRNSNIQTPGSSN